MLWVIDADLRKATSRTDAIIYWNSCPELPGAISVPALVEADAEQLRVEYVNWCSELARFPVAGGTLASALSSRLLHGGSLWWTTLISEKEPALTPEIYDVFRLRTLEKYYTTYAYHGLCYVGGNLKLHRVFRQWCKEMGHPYIWEKTRTHGADGKPTWRRFADMLPHPVRALLHLGSFLLTRYVHTFFERGGRTFPLADADLAIVTYFPNIDLDAAKRGKFESNYWGPLHGLVDDLGLRVNWIWLYVHSAQMSYRESVAFRWMLNQRSSVVGERYLMLEERLRFPSILTAIREYMRLLRISLVLTRCHERFQLLQSKINFFQVLKDAWYRSLRGVNAMAACLNVVAFRDTIRALPPSTRHLLYLWENQGWEQSLLYLWKASHRAESLAVVHSNSCTAPMYLRGCLGKDPVEAPYGRSFPRRLVTIGSEPRRTLVAWGWPAAIVVEAEALRYMYLAGQFGTGRRPMPAVARRLLVITGHMRSESEQQLNLLAVASRLGGLRLYSQITVKAHPDTPVSAIVAGLSFGEVGLQVTNFPLTSLLTASDVVYAANSTSASVEAAWFGLPLIIAAPTGQLNRCPLSGIAGLKFVSTPEVLVDQLRNPTRVNLPRDYYSLNACLPKWRALLKS